MGPASRNRQADQARTTRAPLSSQAGAGRIPCPGDHRIACLHRGTFCANIMLSKEHGGKVSLAGEERLPLSDTAVTEQIADRIRMLRLERRWSARELAEACDRQGVHSLSRATIAKIESGLRKSLRDDEVAALATVFGISAANLLGTSATREYSQPPAAVAVTAESPQGPMISERYQSRDRFGAGAMGSVWLAQDTLLERP